MSSEIPAAGLPAAPGGPRAAGIVLRAAVYIDGFNLYHAINDMGVPHLKWLDLWALSEKLIRHGEHLQRVVWCTAVNKKHLQKMLRWREYKKALEHAGVICCEGHFTEEPRRCDRGHHYFQATEKEGDVNVAISLISDGHLDRYDVAYLVSGDSDQLGTVKMFLERLADKQIISVAPPGRPHSKAVIDYSHDTKTFHRDVIENCLFVGPTIIDRGTLIAKRPPSYEPPEGWTPPPLEA